MSLQLTQQEADSLLAMEKYYNGDTNFTYPSIGGDIRITLYSKDKSEEFSFDIWRSHIELQKNKLQNRTRRAIILARIDLGGPPHCNPDGEEIPYPHLHLYREDYADKWAIALPATFTNPLDSWQTMQEFMNYCNIIKKPNISRELFT
jgi:hypothetical protein